MPTLSLARLTILSAALILAACGGESSKKPPEPESFSVTTNFNSGGTLSPGSITAKPGEEVVIGVAADTYFHLNTIAGCGGELSGGEYVIAEVNQDCTVSAEFARDYVELTGTATHISGVETLEVSLDGLDDDLYRVVNHVEGNFSVRISVTEAALNEEHRLRLRVNGQGQLGNPLQYTTSLPELTSLYQGQPATYSAQQLDALNVTALTTAVDAYIVSLVEDEFYSSDTYKEAFRVFHAARLLDRLTVAEVMYRENNSQTASSETLFETLSSVTKINPILDALDVAERRSIYSDAVIRLSRDSRKIEHGEMFSFNPVFTESDSKTYLAVDDSTIKYADDKAFNKPLPYQEDNGVLTVEGEPAARMDETQVTECLVQDVEIDGYPDPWGQSIWVPCVIVINSVWNSMSFENGIIAGAQMARIIPEHERDTSAGPVVIKEQTSFFSRLELFEKMPEEWVVGGSQLDFRTGDKWVLPSLESASGTNLFQLNSDQTFQEQMLFESHLPEFSAYKEANPESFNESGTWQTEAGQTRLRLDFGTPGYLTIEGISNTETSYRYLVSFIAEDDTLASRWVMRLGRAQQGMSATELQARTNAQTRLRARPRGQSRFHYPAINNELFAWNFGESAGNAVHTRCEAPVYQGDNCDGSLDIFESYPFDIELVDSMLFTTRALGSESFTYRGFVILEGHDDDLVIFEQGLYRSKFYIDEDATFMPYLPGRVVVWTEVQLPQ